MPTSPRSRAFLLGATAASFVAVLAGCSSTATSTTGSGASGSGASSSGSSTGTYKDGTYTEQGDYTSPGGQETISVELTIASNAVKAVTVKTVKADPTAQQYEAQFAGGISSAIVGKKINDLNVTTVAGSSLTSQGFDDALAKIKASAKA